MVLSREPEQTNCRELVQP